MTRPTERAIEHLKEAVRFPNTFLRYSTTAEAISLLLSLFPEGRSEQDQGGETERTLAEYRKSLDLTEAACRSLDAELSAVRLRIKALETLMAALEGFDDDYMTSEAHHPNYVLIPVAKFEAIRAVLSTSDKPASVQAPATAPEPPWPIGSRTNCKRRGWAAYFEGRGREDCPFPRTRSDLHLGYREGWDAAQTAALDLPAPVQAAAGAGEDFKHWPGGERPVMDQARVDLQLSDDTTASNVRAGKWDWRRNDSDVDLEITAWRLAAPRSPLTGEGGE